MHASAKTAGGRDDGHDEGDRRLFVPVFSGPMGLQESQGKKKIEEANHENGTFSALVDKPMGKVGAGGASNQMWNFRNSSAANRCFGGQLIVSQAGGRREFLEPLVE